MSKKFLFGFVLGLSAVLAATLCLLSVLMPDDFGWFSLSWAIALMSGVFGVAFIVRGVFSKNAIPLKKFNIYFGAGFLIVAFLCLINELAIKNEIVLPVIALVIAAALLLGFVAVGGKKWDGGDNEKAGYKNYYQRKAEEEKNKEDK